MVEYEHSAVKYRKSAYFIYCCFTVYFLLFYVNYNLPIFYQIFAHFAYTSVTVDRTEGQSYPKCELDRICFFRENSYGWPYHRNDAYCGQDYPEQTYTVNDKYYILKRSTYVYDEPCVFGEKAYYFSLFPNWSVADNRLPSESFWSYFVLQSKAIFVWLIIFSSYSLFVFRTNLVSRAASQIKLEFQGQPQLNSIVLSLFVPIFFVLAIHIAANVLDFESVEALEAYRNGLMFMVCICCFMTTSRMLLRYKLPILLFILYAEQAIFKDGPAFIFCSVVIYLLWRLFAVIEGYFSRPS